MEDTNQPPKSPGIQNDGVKAIVRARCGAVSKGGGRCMLPSEYRSRYCFTHRAILEGSKDRVKPIRINRGKYLSTTVKELYEAFMQDEDLYNLNHELAIFKAHFYAYLEACKDANIQPDPRGISLYMETMSRTVERVTGKKFQLTVGGTEMMIEKVVEILEKNLIDNHPEILKAIANELTAIPIEPEHLEGTENYAQLKLTYGAKRINELRAPNDSPAHKAS